MLNSLILEMTQGVSYGSGALKALQNDSLPELDLLVREAIQNSSDAALGEDSDSFRVSFNMGDFDVKKLNHQLEDAEYVLNRKFPGNRAKYLEIRDIKTSGLTGPVRVSELDREDHGNYYKLVFDTGKEQTNSSSGEAGGSWGYGKSVYYRVGIGLVIFYSRIRTDNGYESRLIVSLIENENEESAILNSIREKAVGRAWWGKRESGDLLPITDEAKIEKFLNIFSDVKKFKDNQTGTAVIIPYIDEDRLLENIFPDNCGVPDDDIRMCGFKSNLKQYIELAIQKWYAPKIFNKKIRDYGNQKWLDARVDGKAIRNNEMRDFFQLVQELYLTAISANCPGKDTYVSDKYPDIKCSRIPSNKLNTTTAGHVASIRITKNEMAGSNTISPYTYLRLFEKSSLNDPIVMFARSPGMILDYKISGQWAKGLLKPNSEDEFLIAFYVPDSDAVIKSSTGIPKECAGQTLGEYLRGREKSDHMDWTDLSQFTLITNIKKQIVSKVNAAHKDTEIIPIEGTASKLSGKLGRKLLPSLDYGKTRRSGGSGGAAGGSAGSGRKKDFEFEIKNQVFTPTGMTIDFEAKFNNSRKNAVIGLYVESEVGLFDAAMWRGGIGTEFPLSIIAVDKCTVNALNSHQVIGFTDACTPFAPLITNEFSSIEILTLESGSNVVGFRIVNNVTNATVSGRLEIRSENKSYCCTIKEALFVRM